MLLHGNARLTPFQRALLCERVREEGWTVEEAADAAGCSERTVYRWLARRDAGESMMDRSSAPQSSPDAHASEGRGRDRTVAAVALDEHSDRGDARDGGLDGVCGAGALGLNRLWKLGPPEPPNRYCRRHAGELVHVDVKKLGRFHRPGHRVRGRGPAATATAPGGKRSTSASMTPPDSRTSKSSPTNAR